MKYMDGQNIVTDEKIVERLKRKIIVMENKNLKTKEKSDQDMVKWIKAQIEEEVKCYLNR